MVGLWSNPSATVEDRRVAKQESVDLGYYTIDLAFYETYSDEGVGKTAYKTMVLTGLLNHAIVGAVG